MLNWSIMFSSLFGDGFVWGVGAGFSRRGEDKSENPMDNVNFLWGDEMIDWGIVKSCFGDSEENERERSKEWRILTPSEKMKKAVKEKLIDVVFFQDRNTAIWSHCSTKLLRRKH